MEVIIDQQGRRMVMLPYEEWEKVQEYYLQMKREESVTERMKRTAQHIASERDVDARGMSLLDGIVGEGK